MHDIRSLRADPQAFDAAMARRGLGGQSQVILALDAERREAIQRVEAALKARNERAKAIGMAKAKGDTAEVERLMASPVDDIAAATSEQLARSEAALNDTLSALPNILDAEVPEGADETANRVLHQHGEPASLPFKPREHFELGEALGLMDFESAARLSGSRFVVLKGALARLERALGQWMLDQHTGQNGYTEVSPPLLVNAATLYGTGQLPKFEEDLFRTDDKFLIPTAEVPLTNLVAQQIIAEPIAPLRFTALTPSFRSEAGSAGRDTRGMLRQHQFYKVELVSITRPEDSDGEHERMTGCAEAILTALGLTWRRLFLCAGDTGFGAARTYDLEVWLPGQQAWREISSCSNTRDFQARRMNARFKRGKDSVFVHSLNGSGVAVGRALIAVLETHQREDGTIAIPAVLQPYMGGLTQLG
ncbi:serine--tRNA ligase [Rhodovarius sp.]|jgi:seryl-tRNA synthetase|uniref:serine--tRNA ligase n=1 Tax=Rhodovarius sp. TaxID=2972673 RepID=UPI0034A2915B